MGAPNVTLPWYLVCGKELTVLGSFRYALTIDPSVLLY
jgi:hypothetical protein